MIRQAPLLLLTGAAAAAAFLVAAVASDALEDSRRWVAPEPGPALPLLQPADAAAASAIATGPTGGPGEPEDTVQLQDTGLFGPTHVAASRPFTDVALTTQIPGDGGVPIGEDTGDLPVLDVPMGFEDPCTAGEDNCPEGEAGTIGGEAPIPPPLAIRASPRYVPCDGSGRGGADAFVEVFTNTPAEVSIAYPVAIGDESVESALVTVAATREQENRWRAYFLRWGEAPPAGSPDSPRHCARLQGSPKGEYWVRLSGTDIFGSEDTAVVFLSVAGGRPPVVIEGRGQTTLHVEAPSRNIQTGKGVALAVVGVEGGGECAAAETDDAALPRGFAEGEASFVDPGERAASPYDESYTHRFVWNVDLEEGREYVACLWWYSEEFGEHEAVERQSYSVVVPDRMRYRMRISQVIGIEGVIPERSIRVAAEGCEGGPQYVPGEFLDSPAGGVVDWHAEPEIELCDSGGASVPDEITIHVTFGRREGERYEADFAVRTMTEKCPIAVCEIEYTLPYFVPIPAYEEVASICGSGFWECDPEDETVTPGWVIVEVERYDGPRSGVLEWVLGPAEGFAPLVDEGPPPYARVGDARAEADRNRVDALRVTFETDRPVRARAVTENFHGSGCPGGTDASSAEFATTHDLLIEDLCAGQDYHVTLVLTDEAGVVTVHWLFGLQDLELSSVDLEADYQRPLSLRGVTNEYAATMEVAAEITVLDLPNERGTVSASPFTCTLWGLELGQGEANEVAVGDTGHCDRREIRTGGTLAIGGRYSVRAAGQTASTGFSWNVYLARFIDDGGLSLTLLSNDPWVDYGEGDVRPQGVEPTNEPVVLRIELTIDDLRIAAPR